MTPPLPPGGGGGGGGGISVVDVDRVDFGEQPRPQLCIAHAFQRRFAPAVERPAGEERAGQGRAAGRVGVPVAGDVDALVAGTLQEVQHVVRLPPHGGPHALDVRDLDAHSRSSADLDGLVERDEQADTVASLVAHVRRVDLAALGRGLSQLDDLLQAGVVSRRVEKPGRKAHRPGVEAIRDQAFHPVHLDAIRGPGVEADDTRPHGAVAHLDRQVQGRSRAFDGVEISAEVRPGDLEVVRVLGNACLE